MIVTRLKLKNWRNFRSLDVPLRERGFIIGPNASGKSNFLDVFRFLRDIVNPSGGGLQKAVNDRGGITKIRCLAARRDPEVSIEVHLAANVDVEAEWVYSISFRSEGKGKQRLILSSEKAIHSDRPVFERPDEHDEKDGIRLTETYLENLNSNAEFREIADFFRSLTYLHLLPQLLRFSDAFSQTNVEDDPFGQAFLQRIAKCTKRTRESRLRRIQDALQVAVPQLRELRFDRDAVSGKPHLEARYDHWRPNAGWQREDQFSDGTLRLIGLMWVLLEGDSLLLMEEPELSLNDGIVRRIPELISRMQRKAKYRRQVLISTHSEALLSDPSIDGREVLRLEPTPEGTEVKGLTDEDKALLKSGFPVSEVLMPKTKPSKIEQLELLF